MVTVTPATEAQAKNEAAWFPRTSGRSASLRLAVPVLLLSYYVLQCGWFIRTQSFTFDEPVHIVTGLEDRKSVV